MSKRSAEQMLQGGAAPAAGTRPRSRRNSITAPSPSDDSSLAASSTAAAAAAVPSGGAADDDAASAPARRGGRQAAVVEVRAAQVEAMSRVATVATHGVDCPSWYGFKKIEFVSKRTAGIGPGRQWRNVRQIVDRENYHALPPDVQTFSSLRSAPSSVSARKYCDVSGLPAPYTDPRTRLHYHSGAEYKRIKERSTDVVKLMLELRGQTPTHQLMLR